MSLQPINRTSIPFLWRHEDEAEIIKEYIFTIQQERQQGVDEDEAELSDTETIYSDATSADASDDPMDVDEAETERNGEKGENKSVGTHEEGTDGNGVGSCATNEDPKSEFPIGMYNKDEEEVRESQRAWDAVALGSPPFDKRESLVQWHEYLMRALNEMDEELAKKEGTPSLAIKRREPAIGLEEGGIIEKVSDKLRMRSTIEVEHAPIENLRRGLVYLARFSYIRAASHPPCHHLCDVPNNAQHPRYRLALHSVSARCLSPLQAFVNSSSTVTFHLSIQRANGAPRKHYIALIIMHCNHDRNNSSLWGRRASRRMYKSIGLITAPIGDLSTAEDEPDALRRAERCASNIRLYNIAAERSGYE